MIYLQLFWTFFQIGLFTFGGGYAMIPMITNRVVANNWLTLEEIIDFIAISESTPGPFAINISTFVGSTQAGFLGSFCATLGVVLPSFIIILLIAKYFYNFRENQIVSWGLQGLRPAVVGLIGAAVFSVASVAFLNIDFSAFANTNVAQWFNWRNIVIFGVVFGINLKKKLHPIAIIVISAVLGMVLYGVFGGVF